MTQQGVQPDHRDLRTARTDESLSFWSLRLALVPVLLFIVTAAFFYWFNISDTVESQALLTTLNILFCCSVSLLIVYLAARSYVATGSRAVLLMGCGALFFAIINLLGGIMVTDPNTAVTVYNVGFCLSGLCFLCSAFLALTGKPHVTVPAVARSYLSLCYVVVLVAMGLLTLGALAGMTPSFYVSGSGFTLLRQAILDVSMIEFILASVCLGVIYHQSRSPFMLWYSLGLLLIGMAGGILVIGSDVWTSLTWIGRGGLYMGGIYLLVAIWSLTRSGGDLRILLEESLYEAEEKYRRIVETASEGIWIVDSEAKTTYVNKRLAEMLGYTPEEMIGRSGRDFTDEEGKAISRANMEKRRQGVGEQHEMRLIRKDGSLIWAMVNAMPDYDKDGRFVGSLSMLTDITERKRNEEALIESEQRFSLIYEKAPFAMALSRWDDGALVDVNERWVEIFGYTKQEAVGKKTSELGINRDFECRARVLAELHQNGSVHDLEIALFTKSGEKLIVSNNMDMVMLGGEQYLLSTVDDITERKHVERTLRETRDYLESLINYANAPIIVWDPEFTITRFNNAFERLSGYAASEVLGKNLSVLFPPDSIDESLKNIRKTLTGEYWESVEIPILHKKGSIRIALWNSANIYGADNALLATIAQGQDITERKRIEKEREQLLAQVQARTSQLQQANEELEIRSEEIAAQSEELQSANEELRTNNEDLEAITTSLSESEEKYRTIVETAEEGIWIIDANDRTTFINPKMADMLGYTIDEMIGMPMRPLMAEEFMANADEWLEKSKKGAIQHIDYRFMKKDGSDLWCILSSHPLYDRNNRYIGLLAMVMNINKRKQAEKDLEEAKMQAELYLDLMGHDISNMHQIILMQLEMAEDILSTKGKLEGEDRELIDVSVETLEKTARLIDNVRKLQKLRSGEYGREAVDLAKVLEETLKVYSNIPGREITIKYTPIYGDIVQANPLLKDVFSNLIDNAVKHSVGPLELGIDVSKVGKNGASYYRVAIEDNGYGIPDDKKNEVFQRFKRGQTNAKGTGLGLYLVKSLVDGFGGYVEIQNRVIGDYTKGTRFLVYLPVMGEKNA